MNFTKQELDLLFEAVEKWEHDDMSGELIGSMFESMALDKADQESKDKIAEDRRKRNETRDSARRQRKERGVMLRAKLITLRDSMEAEEFVSQSQR